MNNELIVNKPHLSVPSYLASKLTDVSSRAIGALEEIDPTKIICLEYRVLLKVMGAEQITKGGVFRPASDIEKELFSKCKAEVVSVAFEAFTASHGEYIQNRPKPGDIVIIAKYSGITMRDKDFNLYRFANDKDVVGIIKGEKK